MSQSSTDTPSRRRRESDGGNPSKKLDDGGHKSGLANVRFMPCNADLSGLFIDQTQYVAIIMPKTMQPAFETFLKEFNKKLSEAAQTIDLTDRDDVEPVDSVEIKQQKFLVEYGDLKQKMTDTLRSFTETDLKRDVPKAQYETFRDYRKKLTKWYSTCQHLVNKLTSESASTRYLKTNLSFSPAVKDSGLREACTAKMRNTEKTCENQLTDNVLVSSAHLNDDILSLYQNLLIATDDSDLKLLMKAFRVVTRVNRFLTEPMSERLDDDRRPVRRRNTFRRNNRTFYGNRRNLSTRRQSSRRDDDQYDADYPPLRRNNFNYRRFKRRSTNHDDEVDDDDNVFERRNDNFRRNNNRSFRRGGYRRY